VVPWEKLTSKIVEAGGRLRVRSALNPMLWLCGIVTIPTLAIYGMLVFYGFNPPWWLPALGFAPVATVIIGFFILLAVDRDKLQSEEFQIRKMELEMIEEKGKPAIDPSTVKTLPTTIDVPAIDSKTDNDQQ